MIAHMLRPKALNALCNQLHEDLSAALGVARADRDCGCVVITGTGRAFAAGADITEMVNMSLADNVNDEFPSPLWQVFAVVKRGISNAITLVCLSGFGSL
jgi:enoyl-CoA hydratase